MQNSSSTSICSIESDEEILVNGRYEIGVKIGYGSFGVIYEGRDRITDAKVAVKMESRSGKHHQLMHEFTVYEQFKGCEGIPRVIWFGQEGGYNILVMELLGLSLEELYNKCQRRFSLKTVLMLADRMLRRLESIHTRNYIHRDIKPENFLIGRPPTGLSEIYLIDFGLAKRYRNPVTKEHIFYIDGKSLTGTARYASLNAHMGIELSRRDDLEELALVLMYFNRGSLPWQGLYGKDKQTKYNRILDAKLTYSTIDLCSNSPKEFSTFLHYSRSLRFDEAPDYRYLRRMFIDLYRNNRFMPDEKFDWIILADNIKITANSLHTKAPYIECDSVENKERQSF